MYFYPYTTLIQTAIKIIDTKDTFDKLDAFNDLSRINYEISHLDWSSNIQSAIDLDKEMYEKYIGIKLLDDAVAALKALAQTLPNIGGDSSDNKTPKEKLIVNLKQDILGIYVTILIKYGVISDAKQFVEKVV